MKALLRLDGLLFTGDRSVISTMNPILDSFAIETEICDRLDTALDTVTHRRLDAVIVDWDTAADPTRVVRAARKSSPNSNSTIVAMVSEGAETHALLVGANFMIHKSENVDSAKRLMRAAYGTMLQNRRRAARVPVDIPVVARVSELGTINAKISDLSVGGLALQSNQMLPIDREVLAQFWLPGRDCVIHASGRVVNANAAGRAGVKFSFIPEEDLGHLENWLAFELAKLEKAEMPTDNATKSND
jgi:hypothetical protein